MRCTVKANYENRLMNEKRIAGTIGVPIKEVRLEWERVLHEFAD